MASGSVSEDFIFKMSEMKYPHENGGWIDLKDEKGNPKLDLILYILGFKWDNKRRCAKYKMLTEDVKYHRVYNGSGVYVRNPDKPYEIRKMKVYSGAIRGDYLYKNLYKHDVVLTGDFSIGEEVKNIQDIGSWFYDKANFDVVLYRQMKDTSDISSEE